MAARSSTRRSPTTRSEEHTSELQSHVNLVCRLLLEKKECLAPGEQRDRTMLFTRLAQRLRGVHLRDSPAGVALFARLLRRRLLDLPLDLFFKERAPAEIYPLSLHAALPI